MFFVRCLATAVKPSLREQRMQLRGIRRGELDELEAVDTHRVLERGDFDAEIGLRVHGRSPSGASGGTRGAIAAARASLHDAEMDDRCALLYSFI